MLVPGDVRVNLTEQFLALNIEKQQRHVVVLSFMHVCVCTRV